MRLPPLLVVLGAAAALAGCADPPAPPPWRRPAPPHLEAVREAVADLDAAATESLGKDGWPVHLPRSRDFPERPLVRTGEVEDLGRVGADTEGLTRALEDAVRDLMTLRLVLDEVAVPVTLRKHDAAGAPGAGGEPVDPLWATRGEPPRAGLLVKGWVDRRGRVRVTLTDLVLDKELAKAASRAR